MFVIFFCSQLYLIARTAVVALWANGQNIWCCIENGRYQYRVSNSSVVTILCHTSQLYIKQLKEINYFPLSGAWCSCYIRNSSDLLHQAKRPIIIIKTIITQVIWAQFERTHTELQIKMNGFTWGGGGGAVALVSAVLCWRVLETGCKAAAEDRVAARLVVGRGEATGTAGRGAV